MLNEENSAINLEDLMQSDSLISYLDEDKAFTFGGYFHQIIDYPGFREKFEGEVDKMCSRIKDMQENLASIQESLSPDDTLLSFINKGIDAYETKEDRVTAAFILGMYVADCANE